MEKTYHAGIRMHQRGMNDSIIAIVMSLGRIENLPGGATGRFFGNREYDFAIATLKNTRKILEKARNTRLVIDDDKVITLYKNEKIKLMAT